MASKPIIDGGDAPVKTVSTTPPRSLPPSGATSTPPPGPLPNRAPTNPPPIAPVRTNPPQPPVGPNLPVPGPNPISIDPPPAPLSGGGAPGSPVITHNNTGDNGGLGNAAQWFLMLPVLIPFNPTTTKQHVIAVMDTTDFNDPIDVTYYQFRAEDIALNRMPTVRRVIISYRDLGIVTLGLFLEGSNDNGTVIRVNTPITIGNGQPTRRILTVFVDMVLTAFRPQLTIVRPSFGGPLSIVAVTLIGEVEDVTF